MATGVEIFGLVGSINATIDIIGCVVDVIGTAQNQDPAELDLRMGFELDSAILRVLLRTLQDTKSLESRILSYDEEKLLDDTLTHLETLRSALAKLIAKPHSSPTSDTTLASSATSPHPATSRISWALWHHQDLQRLEASLSDWISRLEVVYSALGVPSWRPQVVPGMAARTTDFSGQRAVDRASMKIDDHGAPAARRVSEDVLLKPIQRIEFLGSQSRRNIAYCHPETGPIGEDEGEEPSQPVVVEYTAQSYNDNDIETVSHIESATCDLAKMLSCSDPDETGILRCIGYTHNKALRSFGLLYELPPSTRSPVAINASSTGADNTTKKWRLQSLSDLYKHRPGFSLTQRVSLCCDVAKAVLYVHLLGWVHKSVRPDNILFFLIPGTSDIVMKPSSATERPTQANLPQCYLAGFEYARSAKAASDQRDTGDWRHNVY